MADCYWHGYTGSEPFCSSCVHENPEQYHNVLGGRGHARRRLEGVSTGDLEAMMRRSLAVASRPSSRRKRKVKQTKRHKKRKKNNKK